MAKHRRLFESTEIKAISGIHTLLKDGQVPIIGYVTDKRRFNKVGCVVPRVVCFHYGTEHSDYFYFENVTLTYMAVTIKTPEYLTDIYVECVRKKEITPEQFISRVVDVYIDTEMGFLDVRK